MIMSSVTDGYPLYKRRSEWPPGQGFSHAPMVEMTSVSSRTADSMFYSRNSTNTEQQITSVGGRGPEFGKDDGT